MPHNKWCQTVQLEPEVISMSFIPISSLLSGIDGSGFLGHAINLYLRRKQKKSLINALILRFKIYLIGKIIFLVLLGCYAYLRIKNSFRHFGLPTGCRR